jgi:K+/H+ antiporter YhaU regulatory subunit KhtT
MGTSHVVFEEIPVARLKAKFQKRSIADSGIQTLTRVPIMGLRYPDGQYRLNPPMETILVPEMQIVVLGDAEQIKEFCGVVLS